MNLKNNLFADAVFEIDLAFFDEEAKETDMFDI
jgi:hypothetical protein